MQKQMGQATWQLDANMKAEGYNEEGQIQETATENHNLEISLHHRSAYTPHSSFTHQLGSTDLKCEVWRYVAVETEFEALRSKPFYTCMYQMMFFVTSQQQHLAPAKPFGV